MSEEEGSDMLALSINRSVSGERKDNYKIKGNEKMARVRDSMAGNAMICELMVKMHGRGRLLRGYELRKS